MSVVLRLRAEGQQQVESRETIESILLNAQQNEFKLRIARVRTVEVLSANGPTETEKEEKARGERTPHDGAARPLRGLIVSE